MASISEVLDYLTAAGLRDLVDALEIECEDRRQIATLRAAIIDTDVSVASVLEMLTVADLKFIAGEMGLTTSGRKADLIERIDNLDIDEVENNDLANSPEETPNKQNPTITKVSSVGAGNRSAKTEVELAVFKTWLQGALDTGTVEKGPINFGYCPACVRKHARQWFNYASSKHGFYLCYNGVTPKVVDSLGDGSNFTVHALNDYAKANAPNKAFADQVQQTVDMVEASSDDAVALQIMTTQTTAMEAAIISTPERSSLWSRLFRSSVQTGVHVVRHIKIDSITSTPPFIELKIEIDDVKAAIQKGRTTWNE